MPIEIKGIIRKGSGLKVIVFFVLSIYAGAVSAAECPVDASEIIYPMPQSACLSGLTELPQAVHVRVESDFVDEIASEYLDGLLKRQGIRKADVSESESRDKSVGALIFVKGGPYHESVFRQEGYEIRVSGPPFEARISARSPVGFYYALITLEQLIVRNEKHADIYTGSVTDFPLFMFRGVLEGGYSVWSHEKRVSNLRWMSSLKMNSFIYAPKEGEYFRRRWRALYPKDRLDEFKEYVDICKRSHIEFAYSLSPALSMEYSDPAEFDRLVAKYRQIQELGVKKFGIFFDDVIPVLSTPADRANYSHIAEAEVEVSNKLLKALREYDPNAQLFFVPNQYWGWTPTRYFQILTEKLDPEIEIGWTGKDIVSEKLLSADAGQFIKTVGRKPAIGDNWSPFGPVVNRDGDLYKFSNSYLNNPYSFASAPEAERSKFVDSTVADYGWNPEQYDPRRSFVMAARAIAGGKDSGDALLLVLRMNRLISESGRFNRIKELIEELRTADADASGSILRILIKDMEDGKNAAAGLYNGAINPLMLEELKPFIDQAVKTLDSAIPIAEAMAGNADKQSSIERLKELFRLKK